MKNLSIILNNDLQYQINIGIDSENIDYSHISNICVDNSNIIRLYLSKHTPHCIAPVFFIGDKIDRVKIIVNKQQDEGLMFVRTPQKYIYCIPFILRVIEREFEEIVSDFEKEIKDNGCVIEHKRLQENDIYLIS